MRLPTRVLFILGLIGMAATQEKPPFRDAIEYKYNWKASISSESSEFNEQATSTHLRGQIFVVSKDQGSGRWLVEIKMRNVSISMQIGPKIDASHLNYINVAEVSSELVIPFQVVYNGTNIETAVFNKQDALWSTNFKRSIASLFQVNFHPDDSIYTETELSLNGRCEVQYYSSKSDGEIVLHKEHDMSSCDGNYGRWRTFVHRQQCASSSNNQQNIASSSLTTLYKVTPNRGFPELHNIRSTGVIGLDPFGLFHSVMKSTTQMELQLEKTRRASTAVQPMSNALDVGLNFVFGHPYDGADPTKVDLKAAQNLMQHAEPFVVNQDRLRQKCFADIFAALDNIQAHSSDKKIDLNNVFLYTISAQLGSLDYINARVLHRELNANDNARMNSARNMFLDLLMHSGSNAGLILLRDLIREGKLDAYLAARLVAYAGTFVKQPTVKLLQEFQEVLSLKVADDKDKVFANAVVLAYANLLRKTCAEGSNFNVPCSADLMTNWRKTYFTKMTGSATFAERALYVHALRNVGYGELLGQMLQLVHSGAGTDDEEFQNLRVYIVLGLDQEKLQVMVRNFLVTLIRDQRDNYQVRIAAASVLLSDPNPGILKHVRHILKTDVGREVRQYLLSSLETIVKSRSPCIQDLKGLAKEILHLTNEESRSVRYSAVYAHDFFDESTSMGSQLNLRVTSGEFDDLPAFVQGKFAYFLKSTAYEPFGFTFRSTSMRKYLMVLLGLTLRSADLIPGRLQELLEDFQFASREEKGMSIDLSFTLHGCTVIFAHLGPSYFQQAVFSLSSFDAIQDVTLNMQRYATVGAALYTQPNALGFPSSFVFTSPLFMSTTGSIVKGKQGAATFQRHVSIQFYGDITPSYGIMHDFGALGVTQGVIRQRKAFFNLPLNIEVAADLKKTQLDFTYSVPTESNSMEISAKGRTILLLRPSAETGALVKQACSNCPPMFVLRDHSIPLKTETMGNSTSTYLGTEASGQIFDCQNTESLGDSLGHLSEAFNPTSMNHHGSMASWAFLSFLRVQHKFLIQPNGGHCGFRGRVFRSKLHPVKEMSARLKVKLNINDEPEVAWNAGKMAFKLELNHKGETPATDRKGEIDINYEYKLGGAKNNINMRIVNNRAPFLNQKDYLVCVKVESNFQPVVGDMIDIYSYEQPPTSNTTFDFVMGDANSPTQCPTDQFRLKIGVKASAGSWVMEQRDQATSWPYKQCQAQRTSTNWVAGIVPQTEPCYRAALDFTTLSNFNVDVRGAEVPLSVSNWFERIGNTLRLLFSSYGSSVALSKLNSTKDFSHVAVNLAVKPEKYGRRFADVKTTVNDVGEIYSQVPIPLSIRDSLVSTNIPQASRLAYETNAIPSCLVTSEYIQTLDNVTSATSFTPCYSLVSSDCGSKPQYAVFARKTNGQYPLGVRVNVGGHNIEITPDESGRRKQFSVRANDLEVDVNDKSYTLPEGREKFHVIKVRYQAPIYIISSPGAGLLVQYSGSHVAVFPSWIYKNQHCGLCGNFDGETSREWTAPQGCQLPNAQQLLPSYTMGRTCFPDKPVCNLR